jgi:hypothetical protein
MTKAELIKALEPYDDDSIVIVKDKHGWWNTDYVTKHAAATAIVMEDEFSRPFSSDRD